MKKYYFECILFLLVLGIFGRVLYFEFVYWDDGKYYVDNPLLNPITWDHWIFFLTNPYFGLYIPVTYSVASLLALISNFLSPGHLLPSLFHGMNIILHGFNCILVFYIIRNILLLNLRTGKNKIEATLKTSYSAFLGTILFAIHPLQVESIVWASALKELLCGFFSLLFIYKLVHSSRISLTFALLAVLSKPTAVILPFFVVVYHFLGFGNLFNRSGDFNAVRPKEKLILLFLLMAAFGFFTKLSQPLEHRAELNFNRLFVAGDALFFYLQKLLIPFPLQTIYDRAIEVILLKPERFIKSAFVVLLIAWLFFLKPSKNIRLAFWLSLLPLIPVLGFVPFWYEQISMNADHYAYLPLVGVSLTLSHTLSNWTRLQKWIYIYFIPLAILCYLQCQYWRSSDTIENHTLSYFPNSATSHLNIGRGLIKDEKFTEALEEFKLAIANRDLYADGYLNLGSTYAALGRFEEGVEAFKKALQYNGDKVLCTFSIAKALALNGQFEESSGYFLDTMKMAPDKTFEVETFIGDALASKGYFAASLKHFETAESIAPQDQTVRSKLEELRTLIKQQPNGN